MTEGKSTPPSQTLTRRLRSLIANLDEASVDSTAKQVSGWINSFKSHRDRFRGLLRLSAELVLEKATERPDQGLHRALGRFCRILDTATDGEYSGSLNLLWREEVQVAGVELLANDMAEPGSWPEYLALVVFAGELCDDGLLQPDAMRDCVVMLGRLGSNLGLELACAFLEVTGSALHKDRHGKDCFNAAVQAMLLASRGNGIALWIRRRVQELAAQKAPSSPDDVVWDGETANCDADEGHPAKQTVSQPCKPKHPKFYFESGDVAFICQNISFRVQSDLLSNNSLVFSDMLKPARLSGGHLSDGCPCVHLSDAPEDFVTLLKVFYTPGFPHRHETPDFTTFSALLRMATKYKFQEIRSQILLDLLPAYPTQFPGYERSSCLGEAVFGSTPPHPNSVLDLFVACEVAFALPFAYYRACIAGDPASLDASAGEIALSLDILKAALRGQARLKADEVQFVRKVTFQECTKSRLGRCAGKSPANRQQVFDWIHPDVVTPTGILERGGFQGTGYCDQCTLAFALELSKTKNDTWENLPSYFGLPSWNNVAEKPL